MYYLEKEHLPTIFKYLTNKMFSNNTDFVEK